MEQEEKYKKTLIESGLFFYGANRGSFILPPHGYALWKNIQSALDKKFSARGVQNVLLPTLIPLSLLEREKKHVAGFSTECFYIEKIGEKRSESPLVLRPTSEVLFYDWYSQILRSYQQLPFLYNQWCSVFRAEKNTSPFFRSTEFLWQEGHTIHRDSEEARQFALNIWEDYQDYAENILRLAIIAGQKTEGEKFAGALETYTVECLLPDGQCLQLATSHYFGDGFCRLMGVEFQGPDPNDQLRFPFSTSWGTSTRALGALVKSHADNWGLILPFEIAPVQVAFILIGGGEELVTYCQEILELLNPYYRCRLYNENRRDNLNVLQADKEGCPLKVLLGKEELKKNEITLVRRDNIERRIKISLENSESEKNFLLNFEDNLVEDLKKYNLENKKKEELTKEHKKMVSSVRKGLKRDKIVKAIRIEASEFNQTIYQKSADFLDKHTYPIASFTELEKKLKAGTKGLFLIPFCNQLECETKMKEKVPSYSIRCMFGKKSDKPSRCIFCQSEVQGRAYLGRSY